MIKVENLSKKFIKFDKNQKKEKFYAVNNISFEANKGEIVGILGPNGAGKTTLLRMIAGIMQPTSGKVTVDNLNFIHNEIKIKKQIAYLSGNTKLYKNITPFELLKMCGEFYEVDKNKLIKKIEEIIKILEIENFANNKIANLSTGQMQRVNIARCLVHDAKYYILDEATSGLDIISSQIILDFIKKERDNNKCILYSTHYMEEAENICNRVIMINKGKIIASGTPFEIKKQTKTTNLRDAFFALINGGSHE